MTLTPSLRLLWLASFPVLAALSSAPLHAQHGKDDHLGYTDTPKLPNSPWRVHDRDRPRPPVVDPGAAGKPAAPPSDAIVLFDGSSSDAWQHMNGKKPQWKIVSASHGTKAMEVAGGGDIRTKQEFGGTFQLHVEWASPKTPEGPGQARGNSGVFLMGMYEVQILDCYNNKTYADGQTAALYGQQPPLANACRGPGEWQTYDLVFTAPKFGEDDKLVEPATITLLHNGVLVHHKQPLLGITAHRAVAKYRKHGPTGPIKLQDHGNPVRFRNVWLRQIEAPRTDRSGH